MSGNPMTMGMDMPLSPSPSPPPDPTAAAANGAPGGTSGPAGSEPPPPPAVDMQEVVRTDLEASVRSIVDHLFDIAVQTADVPEGGENVLLGKVQETIGSLGRLMSIAPHLNQQIPMEVLNFIDSGKNPDLQIRSMLGRLGNDNQQMLGQQMSLDLYEELLRAAMSSTFPEMAPYLSPNPTSSEAQEPVASTSSAQS